MKYSSLSGTVSHMNQTANVRGREGRIRSDNLTSFRIDGTPVITGMVVSIAEGDVVAVAGASRNTDLYVMGIHNYTTNQTYRESAKTWLLIIGGAFVLLGIFLLKFLVGIFPILLGLYFLFLYNIGRKVNVLLDEELAKGPPDTAAAQD